MSEILFTNEASVEKFKQHINTHFNETQLSNMIDTVYMYIEIVATDEMNKRIYQNDCDVNTEVKLRGVAEFADLINNFLKKSGQKN